MTLPKRTLERVGGPIARGMAENAAMQAMFLYDGAVRRRQLAEKDDDFEWGGGYIEMAQDLLPLAFLMAREWERVVGDRHDWPGVYEYEVTEDLGAWVVEQCARGYQWPSIAQFRDEWKKRNDEWFNRP